MIWRKGLPHLKISLGFIAVFVCVSLAQATVENDTDPTAFEVFQQMYDQSINVEAREMKVPGSDGLRPVTFGAEKEGSSSKILRMMSPDRELFADFLCEPKQRSFAAQFIKEFIEGKHRQKVIDQDGKEISLNPLDPSLISFNWKKALEADFMVAVTRFVRIFPSSPFSFVSPEMRLKIFQRSGKAPSSHENSDAFFNYSGLKQYDLWEALIGAPAQYIERGHREMNGGWEIVFKPQKTYGDFEKMQAWFRREMGNETKLFEAPGHQRVVMPLINTDNQEATHDFFERAGEVSRMLQAYLVLRGVRGRSGLLVANHKKVIWDMVFGLFEGKLSERREYSTDRGPLRVEMNRFYPESIGVEFRTGMKDTAVRRLTQAIYASRLATRDMKDIAPLSSYALIDGQLFDRGMQAKRLNLSEDTITKAMRNFSRGKGKSGALDLRYMLPLWLWENAPFLKGKSEEIKRISRLCIEKMAALQRPTTPQISSLLADWVKASGLIRDIERYLVPKRRIDTTTSPLMVTVKEGGIDVNKIDLGNEFTARMPLKLKAEYDSQGQWVSSIYDMTPESREQKIRSLAESIKENFTGSREGVTKLQQNAHGHSLGIAFSFKDAQERDWRVEWDGISRNYDENGEIVEGSARGGHIEIVSPKYNPTFEDIKGVYDAMEREGVLPDYKMGGSHINVDYELLEKNPHAMARFLSVFHSYRGIIALMFQHMNRLRSAEPVKLSRDLDKKLRDFHGTAEDLAVLLYNGKYFNQRQNRKTRYTQIDVSNFMGSVIPEKYISDDFDVVRARMTRSGWKQQFRVTSAKKIEMRLFDAPQDPLEAALQIKLVRAMLNKALNDTGPIGPTQSVDYEVYLKNPQKAYTDLAAMTRDLDLNRDDYMPYVYNKIVINQSYMKSKFYRKWSDYADRNFPKILDWGVATPRKNQQHYRCEFLFAG
jgi:hypothetical protein